MRNTILVFLVCLSSARAQDFGEDRRQFFNSLDAVSSVAQPDSDSEKPNDKRHGESGEQEFSALVSEEPLRTCPAQLIIAIQKFLGVQVQGNSQKMAWETTNGKTASNSTYREEVAIIYPGLVGLSLGPWSFHIAPDGRWLCSMKLAASAVANLKDYVTLGQLKGYDLTDEVAIGNAVSAVRGLANNFRQREHLDLAIEADNLAGAMNEKLLEVRLTKGSISIQPICDVCSQQVCRETVGKLRAAGITVGPTTWEPLRRSVLYYASDRILDMLKPILMDLRQSKYSPVETVQSLTPTRNGYHANLSIADRITPFTDAKRALSAFFPSLCRPLKPEQLAGN